MVDYTAIKGSPTGDNTFTYSLGGGTAPFPLVPIIGAYFAEGDLVPTFSSITSPFDGDAIYAGQALSAWASVANVVFTPIITGSPEIGIYQAYFSNPGHYGYNSPVTNNVYINEYLSPQDAAFTYLHELGHALGLQHPDGDGYKIGYDQRMTVMSYEFGSILPTGPMYFDIRAIQEMYGINSTYNNDNTSITVDGAAKLFTIWDSAGVDMIDASTVTAGSNIDLRNDNTVLDAMGVEFEHASRVGLSNFWIAYGAHIENAIGGSGNDTIHGSDAFAATTIGAANYAASDGANNLSGGAGNDFLYGNGGNDILDGGADNDRLDGGIGDDILEGGTGTDSYIFSGAYGRDVLTDVDGLGSITIGGTVLTGAASLSGEAQNEWTLNGHTLLLDADNSLTIDGANANSITIRNFTSGQLGIELKVASSADDFINGSIGNDTIHGGAGNDYIIGDAGQDPIIGGADVLYGGADNDTLDGAAGNDLLYGGSGDDTLEGRTGSNLFDGGAGVDTIYTNSFADYPFQQFSSGSTYQDFITHDTVTRGEVINFAGRLLAGTATYLSGNSYSLSGLTLTLGATGLFVARDADHTVLLTDWSPGNNYGITLAGTGDIVSGSSGNDTLRGGAGSDIFIGSAGDDTYYANNSGDTVIEQAGQGADSIISNLSYTLADNVENMTLTGGADIDGTGNGLDNLIRGNAGYNRLYGAEGNDTLSGGDGNDSLYGGSGDDRLNGGNGSDLLDGGDGNNSLYGNAGDDTLISGTGNDFLNGGDGNDRLTAGAGNDRLQGDGGDDTLVGGAGNDTYYIDSVGDVIIEDANEGSDRVLSSISYTLGDNIENATLSAAADIDAIGNSLDNILVGNSGANQLLGGIGNDSLNGGDGNDTLVGGAGADALTGGAGADSFIFNAVSDSAVGFGYRDVIRDFSSNARDQIDLRNVSSSLNFIGTGAFTGTAQEVNYTVTGRYTMITLDTDGNGSADMQIQLVGAHNLTSSDFVL